MNSDMSLTLLSGKEVLGNDGEGQLDVFSKYGFKAAITDLAILTGCHFKDDASDNVPDDKSYRGRCADAFWTIDSFMNGFCGIVNSNGKLGSSYTNTRSNGIRPVLLSPSSFFEISVNRDIGHNDIAEIEYGEYPQYAANFELQEELNLIYNHKLSGLTKTGRSYTFDIVKYNDYVKPFQPVTYEEFEYKGKKYIRVKANLCKGYFRLSNGNQCPNGDIIWVEVSPVKWLIDDKEKILISKRVLLSGIRFDKFQNSFHGDFKSTEIKSYLDNYMLKDLTQGVSYTTTNNLITGGNYGYNDDKEEINSEKNPYGLDFSEVSEEEIIRGAIESGVAVFLHGKSSDGKSARVKQIDPTCEIIYLRNATPESLNGKSVYNQNSGEMIDVPPTWLKKLQEKCEREPDRLHIVFLDEITNALPSIQGIAFNIVLDREVNGIWKLPDNARIVAAGNDMKDSLAANQLAEPLFNRFAHVYIKTTTASWLKWASDNNIHPAIYSYIAYKKDAALRSKYDGEKPNADPRKWEMASKMLYKTGKPEMLRALVGENITKEFIAFCNQRVITLNDVIKGNYTLEDIQSLNTASRYATIVGLIQVDEENLGKVREFTSCLGKEYLAVFDSLWAHGDEERLERIVEANYFETHEGGIRR